MAEKIPFWRSTPPAIFPVCLGLVALGLAWRRAVKIFDVPSLVGAVFLLLAVVLIAVSALSYAAKFAARPKVIFEDLNTTASRGALPALSMSLMLVAAGIAPHSLVVADLVWKAGIGLHLFLLACLLTAILRGSEERRMTNPYLFLAFAGFIVAPVAGFRLGYEVLSQAFVTASLPVYFVILAGSVKNSLQEPITPALRAGQVIHLAPVSVYGIVAGQMSYSAEFAVAVFISGLLALILLLWSGWISEGGWRPSWGAMAFPVAAFTQLHIEASIRQFGLVTEAMAGAGLSVGTVLVLYVSWRTIRSWIAGDLPKLSLAATA
jgi:tellurite resistance protein